MSTQQSCHNHNAQTAHWLTVFVALINRIHQIIQQQLHLPGSVESLVAAIAVNIVFSRPQNTYAILLFADQTRWQLRLWWLHIKSNSPRMSRGVSEYSPAQNYFYEREMPSIKQMKIERIMHRLRSRCQSRSGHRHFIILASQRGLLLFPPPTGRGQRTKRQSNGSHRLLKMFSGLGQQWNLLLICV